VPSFIVITAEQINSNQIATAINPMKIKTPPSTKSKYAVGKKNMALNNTMATAALRW
jgi:hypothetical protein